MRRLLLIPIALMLGGCAVFNPYSSEFSCPDGYKGKCISVTGAYNEAKDGVDHTSGDVEEKDAMPCNGGKCGESKIDKNSGLRTETVETRNYNAYKASLYQRFDDLLKEPRTPVVAPPKVMRVLLLPYRGQDNEFYAMRHVYFFVDEPRWILGDSVEALEEEDE